MVEIKANIIKNCFMQGIIERDNNNFYYKLFIDCNDKILLIDVDVDNFDYYKNIYNISYIGNINGKMYYFKPNNRISY